MHQLLSHTGGVPDDYTFQQYGFAIAALRDAHTLFPPGTAWSYSNDGFATVGAIVAAVSHNSWQSNIENHVFAPLGMGNSFAVFNDRTLSRRDRDRISIPRRRLRRGAATPSARPVAVRRLRRSRRLGGLDARGHGGVHSLLSERREGRKRQRSCSRRQRSPQ